MEPNKSKAKIDDPNKPKETQAYDYDYAYLQILTDLPVY